MPDRHIYRLALAAVTVAVALLAAPERASAQSTTITFEEPGLAVGPIRSVTKNGLTATFLTRTRVFRPSVATQSGPRAVINASQAPIGDETGFQKPLEIEFSHLMHTVAVRVGLNDREVSTAGGGVQAILRAYDATGREIDQNFLLLGYGPTPATTLLVVATVTDQIWRVKLEFTGNNAEVFDDLELLTAGTPLPGADTYPPEVTIDSPASGQTLNSTSALVTGTIREPYLASVTVNGVAAELVRLDANRTAFRATVALADGTNAVTATARDRSGNEASATHTAYVRAPARIETTDVRFTQTGVFWERLYDDDRRVARKTSLFRITPVIRSTIDEPSYVDEAALVLQGLGPEVVFRGHTRPADGQFSSATQRGPYADGQPVYFFVEGRHLLPDRPLRFVLRLSAAGRVVSERPVTPDWTFRSMPGLSLLVVPQHRRFGLAHTAGLLRILDEFARILPVADGFASLDGIEPAGIRFALTAPTNYANHTDPADTPTIPYDQGFIVRDRQVVTANPDQVPGSGDEPSQFFAGEQIVINFTFPMDENRNGVFETFEWARVVSPAPGVRSQAHDRIANWNAFAEGDAERKRQEWNRGRSAPHTAGRAAVALSWGPGGLNRTGLLGQGGAGRSTCWVSVDYGDDASFVQEIAHTFGLSRAVFPDNDHTDDGLVGSCRFGRESVNLLERRLADGMDSVMCSQIGDISTHFLLPEEYAYIYDRLADGTLSKSPSVAAAGPGPAFVAVGAIYRDPESGDFGASVSIDTSFEVASAEPDGIAMWVDSDTVPYELVFLAADGEELAAYPIALLEDHTHGPAAGSRSGFAVTAPRPEGVVAVEIRRGESALVLLKRSAAAPVVTGVAAALEGQGPEAAVSVRWDGADADGDALTYSVSYSVDRGKTFLPLAGGLRERSLTVPLDAIAGGKGVRFRVTASDGFLTSEAVGGLVDLPGKAPMAVLLNTEAALWVAEGEPIVLRGAGVDPEQGLLSGKSLRWTLARKGKGSRLGTGAEVTVDKLPVGEHALKLEVVDADGMRDSVTFTVTVVRPEQGPARTAPAGGAR